MTELGSVLEQLQRVLVGTGRPLWSAAAELVFRVAVMYLFVQLVVRFVGKRFVAQLSPVEFAISFGIGTAVGVPTVFLDTPIAHGMITIAAFVLLQFIVTRESVRSTWLEGLIHGHPRRLVHEGRILLDALFAVRMTTSEIFEHLRAQGIENLAQVSGLYLERSGSLSVVRRPRGEEGNGLRISPPWNVEPPRQHHPGDRLEAGSYACCTCGGSFDLPRPAEVDPCRYCGRRVFTTAERPAGPTG